MGPAMVSALWARARWVWSAALGFPVDPEVNRATARSAGLAVPLLTGRRLQQ